MSRFSTWCVWFVVVLAVSAGVAHGGPRIAIWDPQNVSGETHVKIQPDTVASLAQRLAGDATVEKLSAGQIAETATFSADLFDALILVGDCVPRQDLSAIKTFTDAGGVLIVIDAQVPFVIAVGQRTDGRWIPAPMEPKFAWQIDELHKHFGIRYMYREEMHDQGVIHPITPLFRKYMGNVELPGELRRKLGSRWVVPDTRQGDGGTIYPLIRSKRRDEVDVPPQLYVVQNGNRHLIVCVDKRFISPAKSELWAFGDQTLAAIVTLAKDLRDQKVTLTGDMSIKIPMDLAPLPVKPLSRTGTGGIDPEQARALVRWGKFDGSGSDLGPALGKGQSLELSSAEAGRQFPSVLEPGATVRATLPTLNSSKPIYLRVRGAYSASGAALRATLDDRTLWNESFIYIDTSGPGNFSRPLSGIAAEFTRIIFIPADQHAPQLLVLSNPGSKPLYFDAVQIEEPTRPTPDRIIGLGAGVGNNIPSELSHTWTAMRTSLRTNFIGPPDDATRFAKVDELFNKIASMNDRVEPIFEGTPEWAAVSPERLAEAQKAGRARTCVPDLDKYAQIVEDCVKRYGDRIDCYEIWNEADIQQFWRGTTDEYVAMVKRIVPIIRQYDPSAKIILTGLAGWNEPFIRKLQDSGALKMVDMFTLHPYAGKAACWDMPYTLTEGTLMSMGINMEIYCNESGMPYKNTEWFVPPPKLTRETQRDMLNTAMSRILANGLAKLNVFNAGGDDHPYSLIDEKGRPRLAYAVFADYTSLGQPGARRLDVSMTAADGSPLTGIYAAGSVYPDGRVVVIVNPAESPVQKQSVTVRVPLGSGKTPAVSARAGTENVEVQSRVHNGPQPWLELTLDLAARTVIETKP